MAYRVKIHYECDWCEEENYLGKFADETTVPAFHRCKQCNYINKTEALIYIWSESNDGVIYRDYINTGEVEEWT